MWHLTYVVPVLYRNDKCDTIVSFIQIRFLIVFTIQWRKFFSCHVPQNRGVSDIRLIGYFITIQYRNSIKCNFIS